MHQKLDYPSCFQPKMRWYLVNLRVDLPEGPPFEMVTFLSFPDHTTVPDLTAAGLDMFHEDYPNFRVLTLMPALCEGKEFDDDPQDRPF